MRLGAADQPGQERDHSGQDDLAGPSAIREAGRGRLHLQIAEFASNRFLAMTQSVLQEMLARGMETTLAIPGRPARSVREHAEIVQAILAGDSVRARGAARRHIRSTHRVAVRRMSDTGLSWPENEYEQTA